MNKYVELYDDEEIIDILEEAWQTTEEYCSHSDIDSCDKCPFKTGVDGCIGSILGEMWRREMNKSGGWSEN